MTTQRVLTILDYWQALKRRSRLVLALFLLSTFLTGLHGKFIATKLYEAKAVISQAKQEMIGGGITFGGEKEKGGGGGLMLEMLGGKQAGPSVSDVLYAILLSRPAAEAVIDKLNLMEYYGSKSKALTIDSLQSETSIRFNKQKMLEVAVLTRDPQMAADIANTYVASLDRLNKQMSLISTKQHRMFLEARVQEKARQLAGAEDALKVFQTDYRIVGLTQHAEATMMEAANIHGDIVAKEVELAALQEYATPSHPMINQLQVQIRELRQELDRIEANESRILTQRNKNRTTSKALPTLDITPTLTLDLVRLMRQVKVQEAVYGMLIGMLEQSRISEVRDLPTIQVIESAVVPERKARPKTLSNVLVAAVVSLALGIIAALFLDYIERLKAAAAFIRGEVVSVQATDGEGNVNGNGSLAEGLLVSPKEVNGPADRRRSAVQTEPPSG